MRLELKRCLVLAIVILAVFAAGLHAADKKGKKRKGRRQDGPAQGQLAAIDGRISTARQAHQAAQSTLERAGEQVAAIGNQLRQARSQLSDARFQASEVSRKALGAQLDDSRYVRALTAHHRAAENYAGAVKRVLESAEYAAARKVADNAPDRIKALAALRRESLASDSEVKKWKLDSKLAKERVEKIRDELLSAEPEWRAAQERIQGHSSAVGAVERELKTASAGRTRASRLAGRARQQVQSLLASRESAVRASKQRAALDKSRQQANKRNKNPKRRNKRKNKKKR